MINRRDKSNICSSPSLSLSLSLCWMGSMHLKAITKRCKYFLRERILRYYMKTFLLWGGKWVQREGHKRGIRAALVLCSFGSVTPPLRPGTHSWLEAKGRSLQTQSRGGNLGNNGIDLIALNGGVVKDRRKSFKTVFSMCHKIYSFFAFVNK